LQIVTLYISIIRNQNLIPIQYIIFNMENNFVLAIKTLWHE